jgi:hypothetical protein
MNQLDLSLPDNQTSFRPGEWIEGKAVWQLDHSVDWLEVRLLWFTQGKGDSDVSVEDMVRIDNPSLNDSRPFRFQLPQAPYSFSGKLISLIWAIEIVGEGIKEAARLEFTLSPDGQEIELGTADAHLTAREKAMQDKAGAFAQRLADKKLGQSGTGASSSASSSSSGPWSDIK